MDFLIVIKKDKILGYLNELVDYKIELNENDYVEKRSIDFSKLENLLITKKIEENDIEIYVREGFKVIGLNNYNYLTI